MIDTFLALVPDYGPVLIFGVVLLACLAVPLPASVLVLSSGSFVAAGDMSLTSVLIAATLAYVIGDQIAFGLASRFGPRILGPFERSHRTAPVLIKSRVLLQKRGALAVFLSHTILSPTCPYISYLCGAGGLAWRNFSIAALFGAIVWSAVYVGLGYVFAAQLEQVADILSNFFGVVLAGAVALCALILLKRRWDAHHHVPAPIPTS